MIVLLYIYSKCVVAFTRVSKSMSKELSNLILYMEPMNYFTKYNSTNKIAIYHYYTKSIYEFMDRCAKGKVCSGGWKSDIGVFKGGINVFSTNRLEKIQICLNM